MISIIRTNFENPDFLELVNHLDKYLKLVDGDEHAFYNQLNHTGKLPYALVAYEDERPIGCGAIKAFSSNASEVKRMYVIPEKRGQGVASAILTELENWTIELGYERCILETGKRQEDAVEMYKRRGYQVIPNYGKYKGIDNSVCFEKRLKS